MLEEGEFGHFIWGLAGAGIGGEVVRYGGVATFGSIPRCGFSYHGWCCALMNGGLGIDLWRLGSSSGCEYPRYHWER